MVAMSNEEIGKRITEARTKAGLSGKELAEKIGVAASSRVQACANIRFTVCPDYFSVVVGRAA